jgi:hypothetical protein
MEHSIVFGVGWRAQLFPTRVRFFCLFVLAGWQAAGCATQLCDLIVISSSVQVMSDSCSCGERVTMVEVCVAFPIY